MKIKNPIVNKIALVKTLQEFNYGAIALFKLSFRKKMIGSGYSVKLIRDLPPFAEFKGPDIESIKAFSNDLRKFIQNNDTLSFDYLTHFYNSNIIKPNEKKLFFDELNDYDKFMKKSSQHSVNGKVLSNKEIFETFLYGSVSHRSTGTKDTYDIWESFSPIYVVLMNEFAYILNEHLYIINRIACVNNDVLERLGFKSIEYLDPDVPKD